MQHSPLYRKQVVVDGKTLELRPNFACCVAVEEKAGESLVKIVFKFSKADFRIKDVVALVWGGLIGTAEETQTNVPYTFNQLGDMLVKHGWTKIAADLVEFASRCITGYGQIVPEAVDEEKKKESTINPSTSTP